ncbi:MAG: COQ9 family protein [Hyphococcus sp.]
MSENKEKISQPGGFEAARTQVLEKMLAVAPFDGWTRAALDRAARDAGVDGPMAAAALPGGVRDALRLWSEQADLAMAGAMAGPDFAGLKIREKVAFAVRARLDALRPHKEAARRAAATMALPLYAPLAAELVWKTADTIWRGLGDTSTDFNFYSKRGILSGVWASTFARWLADESEDEAETRAFLDARIDNVMQIEKAKATIRKLDLDPAKPIAHLAKLRYPAGR